MNFQYEIAQNSVTMSVKKFTELQTFAHKNESDQALKENTKGFASQFISFEASGTDLMHLFRKLWRRNSVG